MERHFADNVVLRWNDETAEGKAHCTLHHIIFSERNNLGYFENILRLFFALKK